MNIPFLDLQAQQRIVKEEVFSFWESIFDSAGFIGGVHIDAFEREFAQACGTQHAIALGSGTDALRFILIALGIGQGDEVITVPNTFIATTEAISQAGATPVFVDVDFETLTLDPALLKRAITSRTKAIIPVQLFGQCADMDPILRIAREHSLHVIEDACQAHLAEYKGRKAGSMGVAGAFSFYPGKNLGACGEAGAVTTNDADLARKIRMIRDHGQSKKYWHDIEGYNGRCDAIQAAALRVKLRHLNDWNGARRRNARSYRDKLSRIEGVKIVRESESGIPIYHLFVIQVDERDRVAKALGEKGVATGLHYPVPLHLQKAYEHMKLRAGSFPVAEKASGNILSLPMYPELTEEQISYVCCCIGEIVAKTREGKSEKLLAGDRQTNLT